MFLNTIDSSPVIWSTHPTDIACALRNLFVTLERFIPALKRLSPAYSEYAQQLERAGELLRDKYF